MVVGTMMLLIMGAIIGVIMMLYGLFTGSKKYSPSHNKIAYANIIVGGILIIMAVAVVCEWRSGGTWLVEWLNIPI